MLPENISHDVSLINPDKEPLQYSVLSVGDPNDVDFYFVPLYFGDAFTRPAAELRIGKMKVIVPLDWSILCGDANLGLVEVIEIKHLNDREFDAFLFNPIDGRMPHFEEIELMNTYPDVDWITPKLKSGHLLAVPLTPKPKPLCAFFVRETGRITDNLDITRILP